MTGVVTDQTTLSQPHTNSCSKYACIVAYNRSLTSATSSFDIITKLRFWMAAYIGTYIDHFLVPQHVHIHPA